MLEFPVFSGDEMCFSSLCEARLNELKRKELTDRLGKTQEHRGVVGQLTLDQLIGQARLRRCKYKKCRECLCGSQETEVEKGVGADPTRISPWPAAKSLSHLCRKYRLLCRFCRLCRLVGTVPSTNCGLTYSMAWKRSSVRSRPGPPNLFKHLEDLLSSPLAAFIKNLRPGRF